MVIFEIGTYWDFLLLDWGQEFFPFVEVEMHVLNVFKLESCAWSDICVDASRSEEVGRNHIIVEDSEPVAKLRDCFCAFFLVCSCEHVSFVWWHNQITRAMFALK